MAKKKKFKLLFLKSSWMSTLISGIVIGIVSQHVPELRTYTEKLANHLKKPSLV